MDISGFLGWIFGGIWNIIKEFTILSVVALIAFPVFVILIVWEIKKSGERKPFKYKPSPSKQIEHKD